MNTASVPTRSLSLPGGGVLAYSLYGEPTGRPVHFFHGFPNSRLLAALVHDKAKAANVCLVAADRPGFGESSPIPGRTLRDWSAQVVALADHLEQQRFDIIGVSCGGAYALACAAAIPDRVERVALLAGMGPMDRPEIRRAQMPGLRAMFALAKIHPWLASPMFLLDRTVFRGDPDKAIHMAGSMLTPPDRAALADDPDAGRRFVASMADAYRQGIGAAMHEARLIAQPRPYQLEDIQVPVHVLPRELRSPCARGHGPLSGADDSECAVASVPGRRPSVHRVEPVRRLRCDDGAFRSTRVDARDGEDDERCKHSWRLPLWCSDVCLPAAGAADGALPLLALSQEHGRRTRHQPHGGPRAVPMAVGRGRHHALRSAARQEFRKMVLQALRVPRPAARQEQQVRGRAGRRAGFGPAVRADRSHLLDF